MIVVQTRTSASPAANLSITLSSWPSAIWPWPTTRRASGQQLAQLLGLGLDRLDPVVDVEHLPAAIELAQDRVAHEARRTPRRPASGSAAGPPAASRSRDMSRTPASARLSVRGIGVARERQDVDLALELLEPLLRRDPEALLLVDDDEARGP